MTKEEIKINALLQELATQRMLLGDRAVNLAGEIAVLQAENSALKARLVELEKKPE